VIRVLVVDDSAVVRKVLSDQLDAEDDIEVVGTAVDPYVARDRIAQLDPDVITLDIEMPRMDGLEFLEKLMRHKPTPVIIVSSLAVDGSDAAIRALELGAVEIVPKPGNQFSIPDVRGMLARAVRAAACSKPQQRRQPIVRPATKVEPSRLRMTDKIIAIGASTGGPPAIERVLSGLPVDMPGAIIVQHMPEGFTKPFAERLHAVCGVEVREARDGDRISPGLALLAPAGVHTCVRRSGSQYVVRLKDGPRIQYQRPAVDVLFQSVAQEIGPNAVGVLLTGMGRDGAAGLKAMRDAGARTIAESEETCVVFGMPRAAIEADAVEKVVTLDAVANAIMRACA
jgi:two-component system, chemotaxis family, protein-glutamate methylesterase/glutaminase